MIISHFWVQAAGFGAAALTTFSLVPQILRIWRRHSADDISTGMFSLFSLGTLLWLIYGIMLGSWPMMLANATSLALAVAVLVLKFFFTTESRRARAAAQDAKLKS